MDSTPRGEKNIQKNYGGNRGVLFACCLLTRRQISNGFSSLFFTSWMVRSAFGGTRVIEEYEMRTRGAVW